MWCNLKEIPYLPIIPEQFNLNSTICQTVLCDKEYHVTIIKDTHMLFLEHEMLFLVPLLAFNSKTVGDLTLKNPFVVWNFDVEFYKVNQLLEYNDAILLCNCIVLLSYKKGTKNFFFKYNTPVTVTWIEIFLNSKAAKTKQ